MSPTFLLKSVPPSLVSLLSGSQELGGVWVGESCMRNAETGGLASHNGERPAGKLVR